MKAAAAAPPQQQQDIRLWRSPARKDYGVREIKSDVARAERYSLTLLAVTAVMGRSQFTVTS